MTTCARYALERRANCETDADKHPPLPDTRPESIAHVPATSSPHLSRAPSGVKLHPVLGQADVAAVGAKDVEADQQVDLPVLDDRERAPQVRVADPCGAVAGKGAASGVRG